MSKETKETKQNPTEQTAEEKEVKQNPTEQSAEQSSSENREDGSTVTLFEKTMKEALRRRVSGRTLRLLETSAIQEDVRCLINTIEKLRASVNGIITVKGNQYRMADYSLTTELVNYINTGKVYLNGAVKYRAKALYTFETTVSENDCLTPDEMVALLKHLGFTLEGWITNQTKSVSLLEDCNLVFDDKGNAYKCGGLALGTELCTLASISVPSLTDYLTDTVESSEEEVVVWLSVMLK